MDREIVALTLALLSPYIGGFIFLIGRLVYDLLSVEREKE